MKKENLALTLIIICFLSALIGLFNAYKTQSISNDTVKKDSKGNIINLITGDNKIALISLNGIIIDDESDQDMFSSGSAAVKTRKYIDKAADDDSVKGVILRINSPGGTVGASQEVYNAVLRCRKAKPVVVSMGDVAASGGYYISSAADYIIANPGTLTGSIGVIFNTANFADLMNKLGVKSNVIKSGKFKDIGSPSRAMTNDEKQLLQNIINNSYNQFLNAIIKGRIQTAINKQSNDKSALKEDILRKYADGRILTGDQAYKLGFVDQLGDLDAAKTKIVEMAQKRFKKVKSNTPIEVYDKPQSFSELFSSMSNNLIPKADIYENLPFSVKHPMQPLWMME